MSERCREAGNSGLVRSFGRRPEYSSARRAPTRLDSVFLTCARGREYHLPVRGASIPEPGAGGSASPNKRNYLSTIPNFAKRDLVDVDCAVCGGKRARVIGDDNGFAVRKCVEKSCGFVYVSPRPSKENLLKMYGDFDLQGAITPEALRSEMKGVIRDIARWLMSRRSNGRVLDIGCSFGHLLSEMERRGWQTVGVDPSKVAVTYAKQRLKGTLLNVAFEDARLERGSFDAVVLLFVLEHVFDPRAFLQKCFDLLRPGGEVAIRVPRTEPLMPIRRFLGRSLMIAPLHLNDFSPRTMRRLSRDLGFREFECRVGSARHSPDPVERAGALLLGGIGRMLETISRGTVLVPWTGSLSYRLIK